MFTGFQIFLPTQSAKDQQ